MQGQIESIAFWYTVFSVAQFSKYHPDISCIQKNYILCSVCILYKAQFFNQKELLIRADQIWSLWTIWEKRAIWEQKGIIVVRREKVTQSCENCHSTGRVWPNVKHGVCPVHWRVENLVFGGTNEYRMKASS